MIGLVEKQNDGLNRTPEGIGWRDYISWSQLSTFRQCSLKYRFRYIEERDPEFVSSALLVGSSIHSAIELYHRRHLEGDKQPTLDELLTEFWDEWKARAEDSPEVRFNKNEDSNTIHDLAGRMLSKFLESPSSNPPGVLIGIEESLRGSLFRNQPEFLGVVDLAFETDDRLVIRDYKTTRSKWSQATAESSADQLMLYGELMKKLLPDKQLAFEFVVITKTRSPSVEVFQVDADRNRLECTKLVVERTLDAIATGVFYPNQSAMNCSTCPYRSACAGWKG